MGLPPRRLRAAVNTITPVLFGLRTTIPESQMPFEHWFSGEIKTTEPVTQATLIRIADRIGVPIECRTADCVFVIWGTGEYRDHFVVKPYPYGIKKNTLDVNMYYNSDFDVKKVASVFEEEFKATSGEWLLVGKWVKHRSVRDIVGSCDCFALDRYLCSDCLKTYPPVNSSGQEITFIGTGRVKETSDDPVCYVNAVKCRALELRFGGIGIMRVTDLIDAYHEDIEKAKKRHELQIEDELDDLRVISERHARQAELRIKEIEVLDAELVAVKNS